MLTVFFKTFCNAHKQGFTKCCLCSNYDVLNVKLRRIERKIELLLRRIERNFNLLRHLSCACRNNWYFYTKYQLRHIECWCKKLIA